MKQKWSCVAGLVFLIVMACGFFQAVPWTVSTHAGSRRIHVTLPFESIDAALVNKQVNAAQFSSLADAANAGDTIYLPAGVYTGSMLMTSSKKVVGAGMGKTIITVAANATGFKSMYPKPALYRGLISDLTFRLTGDNAVGIDAGSLSRWDFVRVGFENQGGKQGQIGMKFHAGTTASSYYNNVISCDFTGLAGVGVEVTDSANQVNVTHSRFTANQVGVDVDGTGTSANAVWIAFNAFEGISGTGVRIGQSNVAYDVTVAFNRFEGPAGPAWKHYEIGTHANSVRLIGNFYAGGVVVDRGRKTYRVEPGSLAKPPNKEFDLLWHENMVLQNSADTETYLQLDSGLSGPQNSHVYFSDRGTRQWYLGADAAGNWVLGRSITPFGRLAAIRSGATKIASEADSAVEINAFNNSGTGGLVVYNGAAPSTAVAAIDNSGTFKGSKTCVTYSGNVCWSAGSGPPSGGCSSGSLYTRTDGRPGQTLYVCEGHMWVGR